MITLPLTTSAGGGTLYQLHLWHQEDDVDDEENVPRYVKSSKIKFIVIKPVMVMVMLAIMTRKMLVKINYYPRRSSMVNL